MADEIEAIKQLKARYFRTMDTKDWDGMRQVFTDDVTMDTTDSGGGVITGADDFLAFLVPTLDEAVTVHQGHMPEIMLTSDTTATGIWALEDTIRWPDGTTMHGFGHYHETYEKADGAWRIASSTLTRLLMDFEPGGDAVTDAREVAVVTGGASGYGLAFGTECARRGMNVVLLDRDRERARAEAAALGPDILGIGVDVAIADEVEGAAALVTERFGRADVVLSNVGVQLFGAVEAFSDDEWRWLLDVNVVGAARTARAFLPLLRRGPRPRLAFTTSSSVMDPASRLGAYQASKFAVWGLAETLRLELADEVAVSVIFPSGMLSRHLETSTEAQPDHLEREIGSPEDFEAMMASNPDMAAALLSPEEAAERTVDAVLAGERYVITHGDLIDAVSTRAAALLSAAEKARDA